MWNDVYYCVQLEHFLNSIMYTYNFVNLCITFLLIVQITVISNI